MQALCIFLQIYSKGITRYINTMKDWINDLKNILPTGRFSSSQEDILKHGCDAWSVSIKTRYQGKDDFIPDVVVYPQSEQEVSKLLAWASECKVPVTPWGAGSAVTGAPLPLTGGISLDMSRMDKILNLDKNNLTVTVQAGILGNRLENYLNERRLSLDPRANRHVRDWQNPRRRNGQGSEGGNGFR